MTEPAPAAPYPGACDCHVHVFDDGTRHPFDPARTYTPGPAPLESLQALHRALGIERVVFVQPSPYGTDNACMLDAMARCGGSARGVAVIDDRTPDEELRRMDAAGIRGVRINLHTAGRHDPGYARDQLLQAARRAAPLGWHVQTFADLGTVAALAELIDRLPVDLVIDHFGKPDASLGVTQPGFDLLCEALARGRIYVKLSAPYRVSQMPDYEDAAALARALIDANPDRVLWGTDWPHPGSAAGKIAEAGITPFRQEDNRRALERAFAWAGTPERAHKLLVDNPARLYGFS